MNLKLSKEPDPIIAKTLEIQEKRADKTAWLITVAQNVGDYCVSWRLQSLQGKLLKLQVIRRNILVTETNKTSIVTFLFILFFLLSPY